MSVVPYLPLLVAWVIAVASPGPDFLAVLRTSASRSRRAGLLVALGVITGQCAWLVAALAGLTALLARFEQLYLVLRLAGAAFLIVYGLTTLRGTWRRTPAEAAPAEGTGPAGGESSAPRSGWRNWRLGLFTNISNPKAVVFFGALFAGLLPAHADLVARGEVLVTMLGISVAWFALVAALASVPTAMAAYRRGRRVVDTVTGGLFVALGGALAKNP